MGVGLDMDSEVEGLGRFQPGKVTGEGQRKASYEAWLEPFWRLAGVRESRGRQMLRCREGMSMDDT